MNLGGKVETALGLFFCALLVAWLFGICFFVVIIKEGEFLGKWMFIFLTPIGGLIVVFNMVFPRTENGQKRRIKRYAKRHQISPMDARLTLYPVDWWLDPKDNPELMKVYETPIY